MSQLRKANLLVRFFLLNFYPFVVLSFTCSSFLSSHHQAKTCRRRYPNQTPFARSAAEPPGSICHGSAKTVLQGWFRDLVPDFLKGRQNDFVRLEESGSVVGPGPMVLLYDVPSAIDDEEFRDMVSDGAAIQDCILHRINIGEPELTLGSDFSALLDMPMKQALEQLASSQSAQFAVAQGGAPSNGILFFSGFSNTAMMDVYKIMSQEIYQETGGTNAVACAKAVPNAMQKPLRQVFDEINGDHQDALSQ